MATIRQEINILVSAYTATNATISSSELIGLDSTQYDGTVTIYFEVEGTATASSTGSIRLRRFGTTTDDITIPISSLGTTNTRLRSASFTPPASETSYFVFVDAGGTSKTVTLSAARLIVIQTGTITKTETQIEIGVRFSCVSTTGVVVTNPKYWQYVAARWDGTVTVALESVASSPSSKTAAEVRFLDLSTLPLNIAVNFTTVSVTSPTPVRQRGSFHSFATLGVTDGNFVGIGMTSPSSKTASQLYCCKLIIRSSGFTVFEPQYLLANALFAAGTAIQGDLNLFDPVEWGGVTNTYTFQVEAGASSTSVVVLRDSADTTTYATVTSPPGLGTASIASPPGASTALDDKATTNGGDVAATRILVACTINGAVFLPPFNPMKWQAVNRASTY